jgi:hypothetical protein
MGIKEKMNRSSERYAITALCVQIGCMILILILKSVYYDFIKYLLLICIVNISYILFSFFPFRNIEIGKEPGEEGIKGGPTEEKKIVHEEGVEPSIERFSGTKVYNPPLREREKEKVQTDEVVKMLRIKNYERMVKEYKEWLLKRVIHPFVKGHKLLRKEEAVTDADLSFNISNSIIYDKSMPVQDEYSGLSKREIIVKKLSKNLSSEHISVIKRISTCGWLVYDPENVLHRSSVYILLLNYFNILLPSCDSLFVNPFDEFLNRGTFGISDGGSPLNYNFYFFVDGTTFDTKGDPLMSFLYLMVYCSRFCGSMLGSFSIRDYKFLSEN